jgi:CheY-like chemotaxis protein
MNLGINSLDAMPNGGVLTFRTRLLEGNQVYVSVEDNGTGMTPEVLAHVMEPFYTTKGTDKGNGLGLSAAYGVVKAHGGAIDITSQPGQGTTVKIRFPRIPAPLQAETVHEPALPLKLRKVLLVDDEGDVRFLMTRMLRKAGAGEVVTAASGEEALENLLSGELPDVLILDQNMPGMKGVQVMAQVRDRYPDLPILFSSGQPDIEGWEALKQPRVAVISKPFTMDEIQAKLAEFA